MQYEEKFFAKYDAILRKYLLDVVVLMRTISIPKELSTVKPYTKAEIYSGYNSRAAVNVPRRKSTHVSILPKLNFLYYCTVQITVLSKTHFPDTSIKIDLISSLCGSRTTREVAALV